MANKVIDTPPPISSVNEIRGLLSLLIVNPQKTEFIINQSGQTYSKKAVLQRIISFLNLHPNILAKYPLLAKINQPEDIDRLFPSENKISSLSRFLDQAWDFLTDIIVSQKPEGNLPLNQIQEFQQATKQNLQATQANTNPQNPIRAEKLTVAQMTELIKRAQDYEALEQQYRQAILSSLAAGKSPEEAARLSKNPIVLKFANQTAQNCVQTTARQAQAGKPLDKPFAQTLTRSLTQSPAGFLLSNPKIREAFVNNQEPILKTTNPKNLALARQAQLTLQLSAAPSPNQLTQRVQSLTGASLSVAQKARLFLEAAIAHNHQPEKAVRFLINNFHKLDKQAPKLSPQQRDTVIAGLKNHVINYGQLIKSLKVVNQATPSPPPPTYRQLLAIHQLSGTQNGPEISILALDQYSHGLTPQALEQIKTDSQLSQLLSPVITAETNTQLNWLKKHPHLAQTAGFRPRAIDQSRFYIDQGPDQTSIADSQNLDYLHNQLKLHGSLGPLGWFKNPGLKLRFSLGGLAAKHPGFSQTANFLISPKQFIKVKLGGKLASWGIAWAGKKGLKGILGKGFLKLAGSFAQKGLAKIIGGALGAFIGGPIGAAIGVAVAWVAEKIAKPVWNTAKKVVKKGLQILGSLLFMGLGLLGKLSAGLVSGLLTLGGAGMTAWGIATMNPTLMLGGLGMFSAGTLPIIKALLAKTGGLPGIIGKAGSALGSWLGFSTTAAVPSYIMAAPFLAIGVGIVGSLFFMGILSSAFVLPPRLETNTTSLTEPGNIIDNFSCPHPACKIADIVNAYTPGVLNQNTWYLVDQHLQTALGKDAYNELYHSVFGIDGSYNLQCVGFKIAAEKELGINLPRQNAVAFIDNHPGCTEVLSGQQILEGDNAVWGYAPSCPAKSNQEANNNCSNAASLCKTTTVNNIDYELCLQKNLSCCGHIGVITKINGLTNVFVTSANANGKGSVDTREFSRQNIDKIIRCTP